MIDKNGIPESYVEAQINVPHRLVDAVSNYIIDNICYGLILEEEDDSDTTGIKFYVATTNESEFTIPLEKYLAEIAGEDLPKIAPIRTRVVKNIEWIEAYKKSVVAVQLNDDLMVRPPWVDKPDSILYDIVIEPKMAFGTGQHETTRTCLRVIRERFHSRGRFLDLGCGSGILGILADKLGASYIKGIDYDVAAIENAGENFVLNKVSAPFDLQFGSTEKCAKDDQYDFIVANIIKSVILPAIPLLCGLVAERGILALSGLLEADLPEIKAELERNGIKDIVIERENEWFTCVIDRS